MKYNFSNREYIHSHFQAPRGRGGWAFILKGREIKTLSPSYFIDNGDTIFWVPGFMTLTEAKKKAVTMLEANGIERGTTIYVAP